jgi:hypothetical protein
LNELNDVVRTRAREPARPVSEKVGVSPEKQAAIALGFAFLNAAGIEDYAAAPMNWYGVADRAAIWIENGWSESMIVAETRMAMSRRSSPPNTTRFFETIFATAAANAMRPVPAVAVPLSGVAHAVRTNRRGNISDAADMLIEQARSRERQPQPGSTGPAYDQLSQKLEQDDAGEIFRPVPRRPPPR